MITIFSKEDCVGCLQAKTILDENGIPYNEVEINEDVIEKNNLSCAPTIICGNNRIDGYPGVDKLLKFVKENEQQKS